MKHTARPITSRSRFQPADSPAKYNASLVQGASDMYRAGGVQPIAAADPEAAEDPVVPVAVAEKLEETDVEAKETTIDEVTKVDIQTPQIKRTVKLPPLSA